MGNNLLGSYGKVSSDSVADFEQEAGLRLPESYRRFLLETNGGRPERGRFFVPEWPGEFATVHVLWGIHEGKSSNLLWWKRELQDSLQDQHLAFGVDLGGNFLVVGLSECDNGKVWYWDPSPDYVETTNGKTLYYLGESIQDFLDTLLPS